MVYHSKSDGDGGVEDPQAPGRRDGPPRYFGSFREPLRGDAGGRPGVPRREAPVRRAPGGEGAGSADRGVPAPTARPGGGPPMPGPLGRAPQRGTPRRRRGP